MQSFERVRDIVHDVTGVPSELITAETTAAQLKMDSLDLCEVVMCIEDEFDILVENEDKLQCVRDLVRAVDSEVA